MAPASPDGLNEQGAWWRMERREIDGDQAVDAVALETWPAARANCATRTAGDDPDGEEHVGDDEEETGIDGRPLLSPPIGMPKGEDEDAPTETAFLVSVGRLLRNNESYRLLWSSDVVSALGDWFNYLAVITLVISLSDYSLAVAGLMLTRALPQTLLAPLVGWVIDRYDRVVVMMVANMARCAIVLLYLWVGTSLPMVLVVSVLQFSASAFFEPAHAGVTPAVVAHHDLLTANAIDTTTWSTMLALGSFIGGLALHYFGARTCFLVDAASYVVSTLLLLVLQRRLRRLAAVDRDADLGKSQVGRSDDAELGRAPVNGLDSGLDDTEVGPPMATAPDDGGDGDRGSIREGIRFLWRNPVVFYMCFSKASDSISWGAADVINIAAVERVFATDDNAALLLGLYYLDVAVGTALGPIIGRLVPTRWVNAERFSGMVLWLKVSYAMVLLGVALQAVQPSVALFFIGNAIRSAGNSVNYVAASSFLQTILPDRYRGRVFALEAGVNMAAMTSAQLLAGATLDTWHLAPVAASRGLAIICAIILCLWILHFQLARRRYRTLYERQQSLAWHASPRAGGPAPVYVD